MGALAYADYITISCPSRGGLNKMSSLCNDNCNNITFNTKKTICIKYNEPVIDSWANEIQCNIIVNMWI